MRYKPGDKVRIRTWEDMKKEFGVSVGSDIYSISHPCWFTYEMEKQLKKLNINRILTIKGIDEKFNTYQVQEINGYLTETMIECLAPEYKEEELITNRFEILDL